MKTFKLYISTLTFLLVLNFGITGFAYADSETAQRHMARGTAAMQMAKSPADYQDAVQEFSLAVKYAPDWVNAWFNLGVAQESAEDYPAAINSFNTYLNKAPAASDADEVKARIFGLEYKIEKTQQLKAREEQNRLKPADLVGNWSFINIMGQTMDWNLQSHGEHLILPSYVMSETTGWYLKLEGYELKGIVRVNIHGQISGSCLSSNFDYFKRKKFQSMIVQGTVSQDKKNITLRYTQPWIDKNNNCGVSYKESNQVLTRY